MTAEISSQPPKTIILHKPWAMCCFFSHENHRWDELIRIFKEYGIEVNPGDIGGTSIKTDGHADRNGRVMIIIELKNEIGAQGAEPSIQVVLYYDVFLQEYELWNDLSSCHPCFVVFAAGKSWPSRSSRRILTK